MSKMKDVKSYLDSMNPFAVYPSLSFVQKRKDLTIEEICEDFIKWASKQSKSPYFYKSYGVSDDLCIRYAEESYKHCDVCNQFYKTGFKTRCSEDCYLISRERMKSRLSESRKKYNPRDPEAYAIRHGIDIEEARSIVYKMCISNRRVSYWTEKGMTESDAKAKVSEVQMKNSKRSKEYWIERGFTEEDALAAVHEYQRQISLKRQKERTKDQFWIREEYWTSRGFGIEEAREKVNEKKLAMATKIKDTSGRKSKAQKRQDHPLTIDFYIARGFDKEHAISEIQSKLAKRSGGKFVSKISQEFCEMIAPYFEGDSLHYHSLSKEFSSWDHENSRVYFYDFVNTTQKFVVEFHGDYWHSIDDPKDLIKENVMRDRGFSYFVIWESDFRKDKKACINSLIERIKHESNKN